MKRGKVEYGDCPSIHGLLCGQLTACPVIGSDPTAGDLKPADAAAASGECGRYAANGRKNGLGGNIEG